ncbi:MAG TPA: DinB family protein [Bacteroidia bacterium]|nr:DinB family protein [Bacteroidia bacterium]
MKTQFEILRQTRANFLKLIDGHSLATLNQVPVGYNNNLIWNFGHAIVSTQLLIYRPTGQPMHIDDALIEKYRRGTKPDGKVNSAELETLRTLCKTTLDALEADHAAGAFSQFEAYTTGFGVHLTSAEDAMRFIPLHEALHLGYAMALKRMLG